MAFKIVSKVISIFKKDSGTTPVLQSTQTFQGAVPATASESTFRQTGQTIDVRSVSTSGGSSSLGGSSGGDSSRISGTTPTEQTLQQSLPSNLRNKSVAQVQAARSSRTLVSQIKNIDKRVAAGVTSEAARKQNTYDVASQSEINRQLGISQYQSTTAENERVRKVNVFADQQRSYYQSAYERGEIDFDEANKKLQRGVDVYSENLFVSSFPKGTKLIPQSTASGTSYSILPSEDVLKSGDIAGRSAIKEKYFLGFRKDQPIKSGFKETSVALTKIGISTYELGVKAGRASIAKPQNISKEFKREVALPTQTLRAYRSYSPALPATIGANVAVFSRGGFSLAKSGFRSTGAVVSELKAGQGLKAFRPSPETSEAFGNLALRSSFIQPRSANLFREVTPFTKSSVKIAGVKQGTRTLETFKGTYKDIPNSRISGQRILFENKQTGRISGLSVVETSVPETRFNLKGLEIGRRSDVSFAVQTSRKGNVKISDIRKINNLIVSKPTSFRGRKVSSVSYPIASVRTYGKTIQYQSQTGNTIFEKSIAASRLLGRKQTPLGTLETSAGVSGTQFGETSVGLKRDFSISKILKLSSPKESRITFIKIGGKKTPFSKTFGTGQTRQTASPSFKQIKRSFQSQETLPLPRTFVPTKSISSQIQIVKLRQRFSQSFISAVGLKSLTAQRQKGISVSKSRLSPAQATKQFSIPRTSQALVPRQSVRVSLITPSPSITTGFSPGENLTRFNFFIPPTLPSLGYFGKGGYVPTITRRQPKRYTPSLTAAAFNIKSFSIPKSYRAGAGAISLRPILQIRKMKGGKRNGF